MANWVFRGDGHILSNKQSKAAPTPNHLLILIEMSIIFNSAAHNPRSNRTSYATRLW